ncbi:MAG: RICIN domain-containing protein [Fibrobacter sp.]|nr:RICIN domain-containing protein [Fibrobacter sp.]
MKKAFFVPFFTIFALTVAVNSHAKVEYVLHKSANPTADEQDAYDRITAVMDSALHYYNTYTNLSKHINVYYAPGVPTAEASSNGDLRFGENRTYMYVGTAMHEMAHTMGVGTTTEYQNLKGSGVFLGEKAQSLLKELENNPEAELHCDGQHFWPYGLNQKSEVKSEQDLINHAKIVQAMYQDMFKESFFKEARIKSLTDQKCMGITATNGLELMDCSNEATKATIWSVGENPVAYRIEFGDRVLDVPNESTAAGVVLGTYYWNGGAHQKTLFEEAPVNTPNAFYLQNAKSKLYLLPDGKNVVQDQRGRLVDSGVWILMDAKDSISAGPSPEDTLEIVPPVDVVDSDTAIIDTAAADTNGTFIGNNRDHVKPAVFGNSSSRRFDAMGRAIRPSRKQAKYQKLF